jgi:hypothetical protein
MYVYDMEQLVSGPELGGVPWKATEMKEILEIFLICLGAVKYPLTPQRWQHSTCSGWSIYIQRKYIELDVEHMLKVQKKTIRKTAAQMTRLLDQKLKSCKEALESLTTCGTTTKEEEQSKIRLLYEFWALTRAKEKC